MLMNEGVVSLADPSGSYQHLHKPSDPQRRNLVSSCELPSDSGDSSLGSKRRGRTAVARSYIGHHGPIAATTTPSTCVAGEIKASG